jgi:UDP-GlcNAc:undecaprenyl-phosphate GlcNAc-1-phosphate transferase
VSNELLLLTALTVAAGAAFAFTPVAIRAAARFDFYDKPKGYKGHAKATPYLGGSAVLAAFLASLLLLAGDLGRTAPIVAGTAILWAVGTIDDRYDVSAGLRVLVEVGLAGLLWGTGLGWDLGAGGLVDLAATCFWVVAVVNAINLFDNMDGASSTMAFVVSAAVGTLGVINGDAWLTAAGAALAGSCLGFLPYNLARPHARIFLGDGGSMPVGFAVAALVMTGMSAAVSAWQALVLALMLVGIPAVDTALVIISRRRKGISVLTGGRDHLTHRTRRRLSTAHAVALTLGGTQAIVASVALVAVRGSSILVVALTVGFLAAAAGVIAILEREEDRLHDAGELSVPEEAVEKAQERRRRRPDPYTLGDLALLVLALGAGTSALFFGFYSTDEWVPIGLVLVLVAAMGTIRRPPTLTRRAWAVIGAVAGLGTLSVLSSTWAPSADQAMIDGDRWLVLAAILGLALVLQRSTRREVLAAGGLMAGIAVVAGVVFVRMLGSDGSDLFLGGRLHEPLGYVNAQATVFLMGAWLAFAAIERRQALMAGAGMTGAVWLCGLTLLSQSRGAALAALCSLGVVLAVLPGRRRRLAAVAVLAAALLGAQSALLDIYPPALIGAASSNGVIRDAGRTLLLCGGLAGLIWGLLVHLHDRVLGDAARATVGRAARVAMIGGAALALVGGVATAGRIADRVDTQWHLFTHVEATKAIAPAAQPAGRLASGAGNRYEYWRVAWGAFKDHPLDGLGAGNFDQAWFADRKVAEDIRQPHSIELQVLSDLGLAGGTLLALLLGGMGIAIARIRRVAVAGTTSGGLAVGGVGVVSAWIVHTSVDWQHLIPGVTAVALIMLGGLLRHRPEIDGTAARPAPGGRRPAQVAVVVAVAALVTMTGALLTRQGLADHYRSSAFAAVADDPPRAVEQANRAIRLDAAAVRSYYAKAAALARLDRGADAEQVLLQATRREPRDPVTWALLGDLAMRRGLTLDARRYYARALALNPLDPGLRQNVAVAARAATP